MMHRTDNNLILYRPAGLQEMELIYDSGMKAFPARLAHQPIFYPVLQLEYARQVASDWNAKNGQFAGYVTQFKVGEDYIGRFEEHTVGGSQYQEFWIPEEELEEFNRHVTGHIKVVEAHFGDAFQGFIPEKFGLQGKDAVAQFTLLSNSYVYNRMDFYLEIKRNHKAIFLNYLFWHKHEFKNPGLKEKVLQAIKEAWLTSFPQTPLPVPVPVENKDAGQAAPQPPVSPLAGAARPVEQTENALPVEQAGPQQLGDVVHEQPVPDERKEPPRSIDPGHGESAPAKQQASHFVTLPSQGDARPVVRQPASHFLQGIQLGLSGKYQEAVDELSVAVEQNPGHVVAHTSLGVALHRSGGNDRALSCYKAAIRIDPKYAEALYFQANILYSRGSVREAIAGYTAAVGLKPELIEAHQKNSPEDRLTDYTGTPAAMRRIARPARRILELNELLETNPRQAALLKERAGEYYQLLNYEQAIADYSASLAIQPDDAAAHHFRGMAYEQMGEKNRAKDDYQRAIAIDPQRSDQYTNRGIALGQMGNFRQSIDSLTEAVRLAPRNPNIYFNRGTTYLQQGDFEKAIDDFSTVIRLSPGDEAAYYWRGISHEEAGRQQDATADYRQFLALSQDAEARQQVEQKLIRWNAGRLNKADRGSSDSQDGPKTGQVQAERSGGELDLYDLIAALGERALNSTWFGSGVDCSGEMAEELYNFTDHNQPIDGHDLLRITSGIRQTIGGDFQAFDPGAASPWMFIRAWDGGGFYVETSDPKIRRRLLAHFPSVEEVEGAEGVLIRV